MESDIAKILGDLSVSRLSNIDVFSLLKIKIFVNIQRSRTLAAKAEKEEFTNAFAHAILALHPDVNESEFANYRLVSSMSMIDSIFSAAKAIYVVLDLGVKFLINSRKIGLFISDHPVACCNPFAEFHSKFSKYTGLCGAASKGLMMYMPVSPYVAILLYDQTVYRIGSPGASCCRVSAQDVRALNKLQGLCADKVLYVPEGRYSKEEIKNIGKFRTSNPRPRRTVVNKFKGIVDGRISPDNLLQFTVTDPRLGYRFNFAEIIDRQAYENYDRACIPIRNEEIFNLSRQKSALIDRYIEELRVKVKNKKSE